jgi:polyhydroxyalkanoate synthesis regulator phasin
VARKALEVPKLKEAIASGEINVSRAKRIVSVISEATQEEWISKACSLSQRELEQEVVKVNPEAVPSEKIRPIANSLSELRCAIPKEVEALLRRVQDLESQRTNKAVSFVEALKSAYEIYLEKKDPVKKAGRSSRSSVRNRHQQRQPKHSNLLPRGQSRP